MTSTDRTCFLCADSAIDGIGMFVPTNEDSRRAVRLLTGTNTFPYWLCRRHQMCPEVAEQIEQVIYAMALAATGDAS